MRLGWLFGSKTDPLQAAPVRVTADARVAPDHGSLESVKPAGDGSSRRDRSLGTGESAIIDSMAAKILSGWLQNRHQTLYPLTVNFQNLDAEKSAVLAQMLAVAFLAGTPGPTEAALDLQRVERIRRWLVSAKADEDTVRRFDAAHAAPPPLSGVLEAVSKHGLAPYAYIAGIIALERTDPASAPFLDYLAARLSLPTTVIRSATRRYGH